MGRDMPNSSLLSDWTRGLVGALYTKLEENDEERDEGIDIKSSALDGPEVCCPGKAARGLGGESVTQKLGLAI